MPLELQVKLLRFVQTGTFSPVGSSRLERVDVRFVCATNRDPMLEVQAGRFREDLYYRLYVVPVELPALRERGDDVLLIARHFLAQFAGEERRGFQGFSPAAEQALAQYNWPGNVRQLQNVVRNIVVLHDGDRVELDMIPQTVRRGAVETPDRAAAASAPVEAAGEAPAPVPARVVRPAGDPGAVDDQEVVPLAVMERRLILAALRRTGQDVPRAAALLEINPSTVYRKLQAWRAEGLLPAN
jgi:two-component system repressor protein LuxO